MPGHHLPEAHEFAVRRRVGPLRQQQVESEPAARLADALRAAEADLGTPPR